MFLWLPFSQLGSQQADPSMSICYYPLVPQQDIAQPVQPMLVSLGPNLVTCFPAFTWWALQKITALCPHFHKATAIKSVTAAGCFSHSLSYVVTKLHLFCISIEATACVHTCTKHQSNNAQWYGLNKSMPLPDHHQGAGKRSKLQWCPSPSPCCYDCYYTFNAKSSRGW